MISTHKITDLLQAWSGGDSHALSQLIPLVDHELRKIAHAFMLREKAGHTLQTTALINEALMRLLGGEKIDWRSRKHFYALVTRRMRHVLIEHARKKLAAKRGMRAAHVDIDDAIISVELSEELLLLDKALADLAQIDKQKANVIEYHHFGGFTHAEVAEQLEISPSTVEREWRFARSWLKREMS